MLVFCGGWKTGEPGEKHPEQGETQQQTQPTYRTGPESNPGHIDEQQAISPHSVFNNSPSRRPSAQLAKSSLIPENMIRT